MNILAYDLYPDYNFAQGRTNRLYFSGRIVPQFRHYFLTLPTHRSHQIPDQ